MTELEKLIGDYESNDKNGNAVFTADQSLRSDIKKLFVKLVGDDISLTELAAMPNIQMQAFGRNIEKATLRRKIQEL